MSRPTLAAAFAAIAAFACPAFAAAAPVTTHDPAGSPAQALDYWTPERMRAAEPLDGPVSPAPADAPVATSASQPPDVEIDPGADVLYPYRIHGKLFFTIGSQGASCSGTVVTSRLGNLVLTAGHCVVESGGGGVAPVWASNMIFVPAYRNGAAPYGIYPATSVRAPTRWVFEPLVELDVGAVNLVPGPGGVQIQELLGSRGVAFNRTAGSYRGKQIEIFGYPGEPAAFYDGERPIYCNASFQGFESFSGSLLAGPCNMKQGASGGAYMIGGLVNSVVSHGSCPPATALTCTTISGTYFGDTAFNLYSAAGGGINKGKRKALKRCKSKKGKKKASCRARVLRFGAIVR